MYKALTLRHQLKLLLLALAVPSFATAAEYCDDAYAINVTLPNQTSWDMCWEHRGLSGISLHHVFYKPPNGSRLMVLYRAELAQVHVPYDDNGIRYHDITDYGFGRASMQALDQEDCPKGQLLSYHEKPVICQSTENRGEAYRSATDSKQGQAFSLFSVSQIGSYSYVPRWKFADDGSMEFSVGATGALQRIVPDDQAERPGWNIGYDKVGISHIHNFFWRLDFDLGAQGNQDYVEQVDFINQNSKLIPQSTVFTKEAAASVAPELARTWVVRSKTLKNKNQQAMGYEIQLNQSGQRDEGPAIEPFTKHDLYVTKDKACELYASHNLSTLDEGESCADNLAEFVNDESIENEDIVVWPTVSFYHMPRAEDMPNMDAHWSSIRLVPMNWHNKNPLAP
ncbi:MAG: hypothetical protein E6Q85_00870 [Thiothrix sp.]|nr:MAG: hypothetical protein E6Q85_00870 [Thiothrix sp.]